LDGSSETIIPSVTLADTVVGEFFVLVMLWI
jgi:hypothetical protein